MERVIILKNTDTGHALTLPVTPQSYPMAEGRAVERLDMAETGQIALPGLNTLFVGTLEFMLPARAYPFLTAGAVAQPSHYLGQITQCVPLHRHRHGHQRACAAGAAGLWRGRRHQ